MSLERKFSQIKNSPEFSLDIDWEKTTKHELLSEIHSQNRLMKAQQLTATEKLDLFTLKVVRRLLPSTAKAVAGFLIVMLGFGTTLAAQAAVPGEPLWPVKRSIEKAEITLAMNPVHEAEIHIKHINKRLNEIDKIVAKGNAPEKEAQKEKAIKQVVRHLEKDVAAVDSTLKIVKEEKKPIETVNLVKKVKNVAKETRQKIVSLETVVPTEQSASMDQALSSVKEVSNAVTATVVSIAVELHEEAVAKEVKTDDVNTTTPETTSNLNEEEQTENQAVKDAAVEIISDEINQLSDEIQVSKDKVITNEGKVESSDETKHEISVVKDKTVQAENILGEAKVLLQEGSVKDAASKVLVSKEISNQAENDLQALAKPIEVKEGEATSTTTLPIIPGQSNTSTVGTKLEPAVVSSTTEDSLEAKESTN